MESLMQYLVKTGTAIAIVWYVAIPASGTQLSQASQTVVRSVTAQMQATPRKFASAAAPVHPLPAAPSVRASLQVPTGGTRINIDGMVHGAGAGGVSGAVGEQQYVQLAHGQMAVYRKQDGALQSGPAGTHALFAGAGLDDCAAPHAGAGSVLYEHRARRWILAHLARSTGQDILCIAISTTADATGNYDHFGLPMRGAGQEALQAEDARMALWSDALYFSFSLFDNARGAYRGPRICRIDLASMVPGQRAALRCNDLGSEFGPALVASLEGEAPLKGTPALILGLDFTEEGRGARLLLWRWPRGGAALGAPLAIPVSPFLIACAGAPGSACLKQPYPGGALAATGDRLMPRAAFRDNVLVAAHAVQLDDGRTGLRWYELRNVLHAAHVYQQGTHAPDLLDRASGSIGIDKSGNIALGYSVAGADTPPGVRYTGRGRSDPPGRMAGEEVVVNGNGVQPGDAYLWAASGALSTDPSDDCTFWYTQQYLPLTGRNTWRTRIASFKFGNCL